MNLYYVYKKNANVDMVVNEEDYRDMLSSGDWVDSPAKRDFSDKEESKKPKVKKVASKDKEVEKDVSDNANNG